MAGIRNGHETWDEMMDTSKRQDSPTKTAKFTKMGGFKREYNTTGWSKKGINFYNKVLEGWKTLSRENRLQLQEKLESQWFEYVDGTRGSRQTWKRKMLIWFQTCQDYQLRWSSLEMMIISLTAHGRTLVMKEGMAILVSGMKLILLGKACGRIG